MGHFRDRLWGHFSQLFYRTNREGSFQLYWPRECIGHSETHFPAAQPRYPDKDLGGQFLFQNFIEKARDLPFRPSSSCQAGEHEHSEEGGAHPVIPTWCPAGSAASHLDQLPFRSPSAWLLSLLNRPSGPSELRIALNSDRRTASWLIVPSRYMSSAFQSFPDCRIK
jgi:hypothetical protein